MTSDTFTPPTKDTYIDEKFPDTNFGSGAYLYVRSLQAKVNGLEPANQRLLVEFDISAIPAGSTIIAATLKVYGRYSTAEGRPYIISRITGSWTEGLVTWNNKPAVTTDNEKEENMVAGGNWFEVDVKDMVQDALGDGVVGFRVKDKVENSATTKQGSFPSKEYTGTVWDPILEVEWTPPVVAKQPVGDGLTFAI